MPDSPWTDTLPLASNSGMQIVPLTAATFDIRAQRVVGALGFRNIGSFRASADGRIYKILIGPEANS